jgi:hypothetical protein
MNLSKMIQRWAKYQVSIRGNAFATPSELESICNDPLAYVDLLRGYDAYEVYRNAASWQDVAMLGCWLVGDTFIPCGQEVRQ